MLKFEAINNDGAVKIIDWSKVEFTDGQEKNQTKMDSQYGVHLKPNNLYTYTPIQRNDTKE